MPTPKTISPALQAWYKWKMLRLPWRRQFLIGLDLSGNTYWEFLDRGAPRPDPNNPNSTPTRWRRIVRYPSANTHPSDVAVPPAWHQWLRHTRADPPSLAEQRAEVARRERMRVLAAQADARWEAKPRVMEGPGARQEEGRKVLGVGEGEQGQVVDGVEQKMEEGGGGGGGGVELGKGEVVTQREEMWEKMKAEAAEAGRTKADKGPDPWRVERGAPSENWQPKAWEPAKGGKK